MPRILSLEGNEPRGVGSTDTGPSMLDRLVADEEFSEVVPNHLRFSIMSKFFPLYTAIMLPIISGTMMMLRT
uniref:40S ribosomal protein S15 n=1 Tax=Arundo donax TaxID=35708 RepID=A0A0A9G7S7_ARUDO